MSENYLYHPKILITMRIRIENTMDRYKMSFLILPSVSKDDKAISQVWVSRGLLEEPYLNSYGRYINKISIYCYDKETKLGGEIKLPFPLDIVEFEAITYSMKHVEDKKIPVTKQSNEYQTWKMYDCEILVKSQTYQQLNEFFKEKGIWE